MVNFIVFSKGFKCLIRIFFQSINHIENQSRTFGVLINLRIINILPKTVLEKILTFCQNQLVTLFFWMNKKTLVVVQIVLQYGYLVTKSYLVFYVLLRLQKEFVLLLLSLQMFLLFIMGKYNKQVFSIGVQFFNMMTC